MDNVNFTTADLETFRDILAPLIATMMGVESAIGAESMLIEWRKQLVTYNLLLTKINTALHGEQPEQIGTVN